MSPHHITEFWNYFPHPPAQPAVGDSPQVYLDKLNDLCGLELVWPKSHPIGQLTRTQLCNLCHDSDVDVLIAYAAVMAWGGRGVDSRNYRLSLDVPCRNALIDILIKLRTSTANRETDFAAMQQAAEHIFARLKAETADIFASRPLGLTIEIVEIDPASGGAFGGLIRAMAALGEFDQADAELDDGREQADGRLPDRLLAEGTERFDRLVIDRKNEERDLYFKKLIPLIAQVSEAHSKCASYYQGSIGASGKKQATALENFTNARNAYFKLCAKFFFKQKINEDFVALIQQKHLVKQTQHTGAGTV